jgi:hypothetical protein
VYLGGIELLVMSAEWQVIAFLPSVENIPFLLFGWGMRTLLLSGTMESARLPCSVGKEHPGIRK